MSCVAKYYSLPNDRTLLEEEMIAHFSKTFHFESEESIINNFEFLIPDDVTELIGITALADYYNTERIILGTTTARIGMEIIQGSQTQKLDNLTVKQYSDSYKQTRMALMNSLYKVLIPAPKRMISGYIIKLIEEPNPALITITLTTIRKKSRN